MVVTNITSCIKVKKENDWSGSEEYIDVGENIKIIDDSGNVYKGKFLYLELSQYEEQDDILYLQKDNGEKISIGVSYILDIQ